MRVTATAGAARWDNRPVTVVSVRAREGLDDGPWAMIRPGR
jgi:hypothetical protein